MTDLRPYVGSYFLGLLQGSGFYIIIENFMRGQEARWLSDNPFAERGADMMQVETRYKEVLRALARHFIYDVQELKSQEIENAFAGTGRDPGISALESEHHGLEALSHLLKGMMGHEAANDYFLDAWQAAIQRLAMDQDRPAESLTRDEVADLYGRFVLRENMEEAEKSALGHYAEALKGGQRTIAELSDNISLDRTDVRVLANDLKVRQAERIPDTMQRKTALQDLDRELAEIIRGVDEEQTGKRLELEELYLLRRLIHAADTGHLASVDHGTPREDLRSDLDSEYVSVDLAVTAAGDRYSFQVKTLKRILSQEAREEQERILERARQKVQGTKTFVVRLETGIVQETYEASLRQAKNVPTSRKDKFGALEPLAGQMPPDKRYKLLTLFGLTDKDFEEEERFFAQTEEARRKWEEEMKAKKIADEQRRIEAAELIRLETEDPEQKLARMREGIDEYLKQEDEKRELQIAERRRREKELEEQALRAEQERLAELEARRREQEAEIAAKKEAEERMIREAEAERATQVAAEEERRRQAEAEKAARAEREKAAALEIRLRHKQEALAEREKQAAIQARLDAAAMREAEKRQKEAKEAEERAEAEKKAAALAKARAMREKNKAEKPQPPDWPPILTPDILVGLDLLSEEDRRDARKILAAKNAFKAKYVEKNLGGSEVTKKEKPNAAFKAEFRTREAWEARVNKKRAA